MLGKSQTRGHPQKTSISNSRKPRLIPNLCHHEIDYRGKRGRGVGGGGLKGRRPGTGGRRGRSSFSDQTQRQSITFPKRGDQLSLKVNCSCHLHTFTTPTPPPAYMIKKRAADIYLITFAQLHRTIFYFFNTPVSPDLRKSRCGVHLLNATLVTRKKRDTPECIHASLINPSL